MTSEPESVDWSAQPDLPTEWDREESNLYQHAKNELEAAGMLGEDSDYEGMVGRAVLELIETFAKQGHSGFSAGVTVEVFQILASYGPLGPLTDNPAEWQKIHDGIATEEEPLWQSRRNPEAFSNDGGKTYYVLSDPMQVDGTLPLKETVRHG